MNKKEICIYFNLADKSNIIIDKLTSCLLILINLQILLLLLCLYNNFSEI